VLACPPTAERSITTVFSPFGRAIDSYTETGRSCSQNREVVFCAGWFLEPAKLFADLPDARMLQPRTVRKQADGQSAVVQSNADRGRCLFRRAMGQMCDRRQHKKAIAFLAKPFDDYACSRLFTPRFGGLPDLLYQVDC
jgi:hypothetical protein